MEARPAQIRDVELPEESPSPEDAYLCSHYERLGDQSNDFRNRNLINLVCSLVKGPDVLDIGCGTGALLERLRERGFGRLVGVEPSEGLIGIARRLRPELEVVAGTGATISEIPGHFDTVTTVDVLEHIEDDRGQLRRIRERLKPHGRLVVVVPAHPVLYARRDRMQGHFRRYTRADLLEKLAAAGFTVETTRSWNAIGWLPHFVFGRCLGRVDGDGLRAAGPKGPFQRTAIRCLDTWYAQVENRVSFGFGLSLIVSAARAPMEDTESGNAATDPGSP